MNQTDLSQLLFKQKNDTSEQEQSYTEISIGELSLDGRSLSKKTNFIEEMTISELSITSNSFEIIESEDDALNAEIQYKQESLQAHLNAPLNCEDISLARDNNIQKNNTLGQKFYQFALLQFKKQAYPQMLDYLLQSTSFFIQASNQEALSNNYDAIVWVKAKLGQIEGSLETCEESINLKAQIYGSDSYEVGLTRFEKAKLLDLIGKQIEAFAEALLSKQLLENFDKSRTSLYQIELFFAKKFVDDDNLEEASENLRKLAANLVKENQTESECFFECQIQKAVVSYRQDNLLEAEDILNDLKEIEDARINKNGFRLESILKNLAKIYLKRKEYKKALKIAKEAQQIILGRSSKKDLQYTSICMLLSEAYSSNQMFDESIKAIKEVLGLYEKYNYQNKRILGIAWHQLGNAYLNANQFELARNSYTHAIEIESERIESIGVIASYKALGCTYFMLGDEASAVTNLKTAYQISKNRKGTDNIEQKKILKMIKNSSKLVKFQLMVSSDSHDTTPSEATSIRSKDYSIITN